MYFTDPSHDRFLHPSDNPNNILMSDLLNGKNYGTWIKSIEIALIAKNKLGFVLGTCTKPDASSPLFGQWDKCDKMVISWLLHAVEKRISDSILFSSSSRQIWLDLEQRFEWFDATKFFQVKDLYSISQGNHDIVISFTEIKKLWDEHDSILSVPTCSCGINCATHSYQDRTSSQRIAIWDVRPRTGVVFVPERSGTSSRSENWAIPFERKKRDRAEADTGETKGKKGKEDTQQ